MHTHFPSARAGVDAPSLTFAGCIARLLEDLGAGSLLLSDQHQLDADGLKFEIDMCAGRRPASIILSDGVMLTDRRASAHARLAVWIERCWDDAYHALACRLPEMCWCPDHGEQISVGPGPMIGAAHDPYGTEWLACGCCVGALGERREDTFIVKRTRACA